MRPDVILSPSALDWDSYIADQEDIKKAIPHRFEMIQLNRVVFLDLERGLIAGYKDVSADEFWTRGHFPNYPVLPGVLMCEAAAQLCGYFIHHAGVMEGKILGLGGMEEVRFRAQVRPGDRFIIVGKALQLHRRQIKFHTQGFVGDSLVFHMNVIGLPIVSLEELQR